jgi:hypothetical protein
MDYINQWRQEALAMRQALDALLQRISEAEAGAEHPLDERLGSDQTDVLERGLAQQVDLAQKSRFLSEDGAAPARVSYAGDEGLLDPNDPKARAHFATNFGAEPDRSDVRKLSEGMPPRPRLV